jgi:hypothetical protein
LIVAWVARWLPGLSVLIRIEQERVMFERPVVFVAAIVALPVMLSFTGPAQAAPAAARYATVGWHEAGYPVCRCAPLPRPGLQPDDQFYYDTPGYYPGFRPGGGMVPQFDPPPRAGFSEGPLGPQ